MDTPLSVDAQWLRRFRRRLRAWHGRHGRQLPWRASGDAYHVWVSEIMLQQTTVAAVIPYFDSFIERFPTVQALAKADEADVLRAWEGLGYYSRARNLHKAAREIVAEHDSHVPDDLAILQTLPGIGRYTAGAIASFAFGQAAPIVEANTLRLYSRLLGFGEDPRSTAGQRVHWDFAGRLVPRASPGEFNQALMDLGSTICTPQEPKCAECPVQQSCRAFAEGTQAEIPPPKPQPVVTWLTEASIAVEKSGRFLLRQRGADERWAGMWDFPRFTIPEYSAGPANRGAEQLLLKGAMPGGPIIDRLQSQLCEMSGVAASIDGTIMEIQHSVTRYRIRLICLHAQFVTGRINRSSAPYQWVSRVQLDELPLSVTGRKLARHLQDHRS